MLRVGALFYEHLFVILLPPSNICSGHEPDFCWITLLFFKNATYIVMTPSYFEPDDGLPDIDDVPIGIDDAHPGRRVVAASTLPQTQV